MPGTETENIKSLKVKVPLELAHYVLQETKYCGRYVTKRTKGYKTHHLAKALGLYLLLKAESPEASLIINYTKQLATLATNFCLSRRSFYTHLKTLERLKLIRKAGPGNLLIASWKELSNTLDINTNKKTIINFTLNGKQKIWWWFAALEIQDNQESQQYMIWKKVNKVPEVKNSLMTALLRRGFDPSKAANPEYVSNRLFMLYIEDFKSGTEVHDILMQIRADVNRSVKTMGEAWLIAPQLVSYWKSQMLKQRIIDIAKISIESEWSSKTKECHKRPGCHVIWNEKKKERIWFLCDQIALIKPWEGLQTLKILDAA